MVSEFQSKQLESPLWARPYSRHKNKQNRSCPSQMELIFYIQVMIKGREGGRKVRLYQAVINARRNYQAG